MLGVIRKRIPRSGTPFVMDSPGKAKSLLLNTWLFLGKLAHLEDKVPISRYSQLLVLFLDSNLKYFAVIEGKS